MKNGRQGFLFVILTLSVTAVIMLLASPLYRCVVPVRLVATAHATAPATLTLVSGAGEPYRVTLPVGATPLAIPLAEKRVDKVCVSQNGAEPLRLSAPALQSAGKTLSLGVGEAHLAPGESLSLETGGVVLRQARRVAWWPFVLSLVLSSVCGGLAYWWARWRFRGACMRPAWRRVPDALFCCLFCLLPVSAYVAMDKSEISIAENRRLATFPLLTDESGALNAAFGKQLESWLRDRFTGRAALVKAHTKARSLLSGSLSENNQAILYRNHWGFFKPYVNISAPTEAEYQLMLGHLRRLQTWCDERHIALCFFVTPMKEDIFADMNPAGMKNPGEVTAAFVSQIHRDLPQLHLCYPREAMSALRDTAKPLHYLTDTHINEDGAYMLSEELVKSLSADFPALALPPRSAFRSTPICGRFYAELQPDGTEDGVAPGCLVNMLQEDAAVVEDCAYQHYEPESAPAVALEQGEEKNEILTRCPAGHYRAVLLGDSNTQYYRRWLQYSFGELRRFRINNGVEQERFRMGRWEKRIADFAPDILVITISGSSLFLSIPQMY